MTKKTSPMMKITGTTPTPKNTIRQHQALAQGYQMETPEKVVETHQTAKGTGAVKAPGFTKR